MDRPTVPSQQLLEYLERVGAVSTPSYLQLARAELCVLCREVRDTAGRQLSCVYIHACGGWVGMPDNVCVGEGAIPKDRIKVACPHADEVYHGAVWSSWRSGGGVGTRQSMAAPE